MRPYASFHKEPSRQARILTLPLSIRQKIYTAVIRLDLKNEQCSHLSISYTCRQIQTEFAEHREYLEHKSFRCCLGRSWADRDATKFYTWDYHATPWSSSIQSTSDFVEKLKKCEVRCTIEEMSDWERRSEPGSDCFKDCIRLLVRTFKNCTQMRKLKILFDHFVLSRKYGLLGSDEIWARMKAVRDLPGLEVIRFEMAGCEDNLVWVEERSKTHVEWVRNPGKPVIAQASHESRYAWQAKRGASAPRGYGLRRGIT